MNNTLSEVIIRGCVDVSQVDKYLKEILRDVLSNLTSNTWRVRESRWSNSTDFRNKLLLFSVHCGCSKYTDNVLLLFFSCY